MGSICSSTNVEPMMPAPSSTTTDPVVTANSAPPVAHPPDTSKPPGELLKCMAAFQSLVSEVTAHGKQYLVTCSVDKEKTTLSFCSRAPDDHLHSAELTVQDLMTNPVLQRVTWPAFFLALRKHFQDCTVQYTIVGATHTLATRLDGFVPTPAGAFSVVLNVSQREVVQRLLLAPLMDYYFARKTLPEDVVREHEIAFGVLHCRCVEAQRDVDRLVQEMDQVRKDTATGLQRSKAQRDRCAHLRLQIRHMAPGDDTDPLYAAPWQRYLLHSPYCTGWTPTAIPYDNNALVLIRAVYAEHKFSPTQPPAPPAPLPKSPSDPLLRKVLEMGDSHPHGAILRTLEKIDDWDFNVFELQEHSRGGSLVMVATCLFYKYGFVSHFGLDPEILLNWCTAVEAAYHPNPYHNSTHAADVTHVLHYLLFPGGMFKALSLTAEDAFAAIISGIIHDFDHPGLNNNFHIKTNAYLACLYNDRSVLENHHCTEVFEMMKNPKYNLLHSLNAEQRKDIRDTILEMVLSTDMGLHAKIFQTFRKRLQEEGDWHSREDVRLGLSIAIKMADISNCGRPKPLYLQWADRIAQEFYKQGDVERQLQHTVSPFMDRLTHDTDFAKGQMSFMNYIVLPLFEAGSELVPQLEWTVQSIHENKEHWEQVESEGVRPPAHES